MCDMSVGKAIARYRKKKAMTQMDLATALNVHQSQIARWETDRSFPRKEYLEELSDALEVSVEQLFYSEPHDFGRLDDDELRTLLFEIPNLSKRQQDTLKNILQDMVKLSRFQEVMKD